MMSPTATSNAAPAAIMMPVFQLPVRLAERFSAASPLPRDPWRNLSTLPRGCRRIGRCQVVA
jgi:hypothetical protein